MLVSKLKSIKSPRNIIIKCNNGDKVKILKLSREETSHIKNQKLEKAYFSIAELEEHEARPTAGNGGDGEWGCQTSLLQSNPPAKNN